MLEAVVLDPPTAARIVRDAITRLAQTTTTAATERAKLEKAARGFQAQIARLTAAIADGGSIPALVAKLKSVEAERQAVAEPTRETRWAGTGPGSTSPLEAVIAAKVRDWRGLLERHAVQARQILSKLLVARLVFTPLGTHYQVSGAASATVLLSALVPAQPIGTPPGSSDVRSKGAWPQRDPHVVGSGELRSLRRGNRIEDEASGRLGNGADDEMVRGGYGSDLEGGGRNRCPQRNGAGSGPVHLAAGR
jgi:hypothetical protein